MLLVHYVNKEYTNICTTVVYVTQVWSGGGREAGGGGRKKEEERSIMYMKLY